MSVSQRAGGIGCFWTQGDTTRNGRIVCTLLGTIGDTSSMELDLVGNIVDVGISGSRIGKVGTGGSRMSAGRGNGMSIVVEVGIGVVVGVESGTGVIGHSGSGSGIKVFRIKRNRSTVDWESTEVVTIG